MQPEELYSHLKAKHWVILSFVFFCFLCFYCTVFFLKSHNCANLRKGKKIGRQVKKKSNTKKTKQKIGLSDEELGFVNSTSYMSDSCMFLIAGYLMDKYGRKYGAVPSLIFFIIATMIVPFVNNEGFLIFTALIYGIGDGFATGIILTIGTDLAPIECSAQFLGLLLLFFVFCVFFWLSFSSYLYVFFKQKKNII